MTSITQVQALKLLTKTKNPILIWARWQAIQLCQQNETTYTRQVRDALALRGLLGDVGDERWLGAIFNAEFFVDTGTYVAIADKDRNIHSGRDVKLWRLNELYKDIQLPEPSALPPIDVRIRLSRTEQLIRDVQMALGETKLQLQFGALSELKNPLEDPAIITAVYQRRYVDGLSELRSVTGTSLERVLNKILEQEGLTHGTSATS